MTMIRVDTSGDPGTFAALGPALAQWTALGKPDCVISIRDNRTYQEALAIEPADGRFIALEAADGCRPHLRLTCSRCRSPATTTPRPSP